MQHKASLRISIAIITVLLFTANCTGQYEFSLLNTVDVNGNAEMISWQHNSSYLAATNSSKRRVNFYSWNESKLPNIITPDPVFSIETDGEPTSVSFSPDSNLAMITVLNDDQNSVGYVTAVNLTKNKYGRITAKIPVGFWPDNICVGHLGKLALVANEAEQNDETPGSIGIIDFSKSVYDGNAGIWSLHYSRLTGLEKILALPAGLIQPEYCAMSDKDEIAAVSCQENDAVVIIDLRKEEISFAGAIKLMPASEPDGVAIIDWYDSTVQKQGWLLGTACEGRKQKGGKRGGQRLDFFFIWSDEDKLRWEPLISIDLPPLFENRRVDPEGIDMVLWDNKAAVFAGCEKTDAIVCILLEQNRKHQIVGIVKVGSKPEGIKAGIYDDSVIVTSANEGENGSISICRLKKNSPKKLSKKTDK